MTAGRFFIHSHLRKANVKALKVDQIVLQILSEICLFSSPIIIVMNELI